MKKFAFLITAVMIGFAGAANAQMAATRDAQYIAVLRAVVNYKIDQHGCRPHRSAFLSL